MSSEWREFLLDEIAELNGGYAFKSEEYTKDGHFVLRTVNISEDGRISRDGATYVSQESAKKYERFLLKNLDTLFVMVGATLGKTGLVKENDLPALLNQNMWVVRARNDRVDPLFLHYAFKILSRPLSSQASGSARGFVKRDDFRKMKICAPEIGTQREISGLLGALDDRINLLRETNKTLEAIAQALFKSWFVDFDPVRAKMEGRQPEGMDESTAALFPDNFEESSLGVIPIGWNQQEISSLCAVVTRGVTPVYEAGSNIFVINQKVNRGTELDLSSLKELSPNLKIPSEKMAHKWDLLINCLGEGTLGRVHLFKGNSNIYAVDQHMSICRGTPSVNIFLTQVLSSAAGQKIIQDLKTGSTGMTMLNVSKLRGLQVLWPGVQLVDKFFEVVEKIFEQVANNDVRINTLQLIRDTLLPRLISGKLRIAEAETELEKAIA